MKNRLIEKRYIFGNVPFTTVILGIFMGIVAGIILYYTVSRSITIFMTGIACFILIVPFLIIYHKIAKRFLIAVLILTLPLVIDKTINVDSLHQGGAKGFVISLHDIALAFLFIIWINDIVVNRKSGIRFFKRFTIVVLGIISMAALSMIKAADRMFAIYELIEIFKMYLIMIYIANYIAESGDIKYVVTFLIIGLLIEGVLVLIELASGSPLNMTVLGTKSAVDTIEFSKHRVGGTLGGANGLAWYLDYILPLVFAVIINRIRKSYRIILTFVFLLGVISLIFTFSRGGWIAFLIGSSIVLLFYLRRLPMIKKLYIAVVIILILGVSLMLILSVPNPIKERFTVDDRGSAYSRVKLAEVAFAMIKSNPVIGVGLNNYTLVHHEYDYGVDKITSYYPVPVHNVFLQLAAEIGIPGVVFFIVFIFLIYINSSRYVLSSDGFGGCILTGIMGGITAGLVQAMVENSSLGSYNLLPFWFLSGVAIGIYEHKRDNETGD